MPVWRVVQIPPSLDPSHPDTPPWPDQRPPLTHTRHTTDSCVSSASATSNSEGIFRLAFVYPISHPLRTTWHFARPTQSASSSCGPTTPASKTDLPHRESPPLHHGRDRPLHGVDQHRAGHTDTLPAAGLAQPESNTSHTAVLVLPDPIPIPVHHAPLLLRGNRLAKQVGRGVLRVRYLRHQ